MLLKREFTFDAAHNLVAYHGKCEQLHGHTYKMAVVLSGYPDHESMILDFVKIKAIVNEQIISKFDHAYLNDMISQPSAENIAAHVFKTLDPLFRGPNYELYEIHIWESPHSSVVFGRDDLRYYEDAAGDA